MPLTSDHHVWYRVVAAYAVRGTTTVTWQLHREFHDPGDYWFTLQANRNGGEPEDWQDVGQEVKNADSASDDTVRLFGKDFNLCYRIKMRTGSGTYYSPNAVIYGNLTLKQWLTARSIIRRRILMAKNNHRFEGYLMKRRIHGTVCSCVDPFTGGITNSDHAACQGTGRLLGYWKAAANTLFDMGLSSDLTQRDPQLEKGTINESTRTGSFIGLPLPATEDVWVEAGGDARYYIRDVKTVVEVNSVPIIVQAKLDLAPLSDVLYNIPLG